MLKILADQEIINVHKYFAKLAQIKFFSSTDINLTDIDALLIRSVTKIDAQLLNKSSIKFVGSVTTGLDHIDINYLKKHNIYLASAPNSNANAVVEYVLVAILKICQNFNKDWKKLIVGIIGHGRIGNRLRIILEHSEIKCMIYDPFQLTTNCHYAIDTVLKNSDIISLHTPLTHNGNYPTYHLIGKSELTMMKKDALLINTSRGGVVDEEALYRHITINPLFNAVIDVWENEPYINLPLLSKVILGTGHIAGYTKEGKLRGVQMIYEQFCDFFKIVPQYNHSSNKIPIPHLVNLEKLLTQMYDIKNDDLQFRKVMSKYDTKVAFNKFRKDYVLRKEFSSLV